MGVIFLACLLLRYPYSLPEKIDVFALANLVISQSEILTISNISDITGSDSSRNFSTWSDG
ncbi:MULTISPECIES: hypothetical protein [Photorhabdus]|uniref:hypothetical protein n=1 Tax=Photorhabdus TaxID=29487 RepID=UPI000B3328CC|nr:hypothetical protein [Photorhabdus aegyptia]MCC8457634.1 hypothetical protein [Photorhabdus aegyptia]